MKTKRDEMVELIEEKFKSIKRKDGSPYVNHLYAVEKNVMELVEKYKNMFHIDPYEHEYIQLIALGHDLLEDTDTTFDYLAENFDMDVAIEIDLLTRQPNQNYFDYVKSLIGAGWIVPMLVKLADLQHNMSDLPEGSLKDKYRFTQYLVEKELEQSVMWEQD